jgi:hypothetical protein
MNKKDTCHSCTYYLHKQAENSGLCFRFPPAAHLLIVMPAPNILQKNQSQPTPTPVSVDVIVAQNRPACGEFKARFQITH